jgi:hypothetical protein
VFDKNIDKNELANVLKSLDGIEAIELGFTLIKKSIALYKRIKILNYPFAPMTLAKGYDPVYWREAFANARIYLLGTEHKVKLRKVFLSRELGSFADERSVF